MPSVLVTGAGRGIGKSIVGHLAAPWYVVGVGPKLQMAFMTNLPAAVRDRVLRRVSGQP